MKKLLGILVLSLLWCNISIANDYNWKKVAKQNTPNIKLYLGPDLIDKEKKSLYEQLVANIKVVTSPDGITKNDDNYFLIDGCRPHACSYKGVVWIDKKKDILDEGGFLVIPPWSGFPSSTGHTDISSFNNWKSTDIIKRSMEICNHIFKNVYFISNSWDSF